MWPRPRSTSAASAPRRSRVLCYRSTAAPAPVIRSTICGTSWVRVPGRQRNSVMPKYFRPLSARVGAETTIHRDRIMNPAFAQECLESLEHYGVLVFHRLGLTDAEQVAFSSL